MTRRAHLTAGYRMGIGPKLHHCVSLQTSELRTLCHSTEWVRQLSAGKSGQGDSGVQSQTEHHGGSQALKSADCEPPQCSPEQALRSRFPH